MRQSVRRRQGAQRRRRGTEELELGFSGKSSKSSIMHHFDLIENFGTNILIFVKSERARFRMKSRLISERENRSRVMGELNSGGAAVEHCFLR